jgi:multidrug resistance protein, MATE family
MEALQRPGWASFSMTLAFVLNADLNWLLIFGKFIFPAFGIAGSGLATRLASLFMFSGMAAVITLHQRFRRYHLFARFWRADGGHA